jgi:hypothetical protein
MTAPLRAAREPVRNDAAVSRLLSWGGTVLGAGYDALYRLPT